MAGRMVFFNSSSAVLPLPVACKPHNPTQQHIFKQAGECVQMAACIPNLLATSSQQCAATADSPCWQRKEAVTRVLGLLIAGMYGERPTYTQTTAMHKIFAVHQLLSHTH
eukprot:GHRR01022124.1.p2 GENE.GHRR01022124.1~~GHRR01022124.1.p2  ORF type:complete len:110 (+),score=31.78 GHRR01022124.1:168-497(+)